MARIFIFAILAFGLYQWFDNNFGSGSESEPEPEKVASRPLSPDEPPKVWNRHSFEDVEQAIIDSGGSKVIGDVANAPSGALAHIKAMNDTYFTMFDNRVEIKSTYWGDQKIYFSDITESRWSMQEPIMGTLTFSGGGVRDMELSLNYRDAVRLRKLWNSFDIKGPFDIKKFRGERSRQ